MTDDDLLRDLYRAGSARAESAPFDCPVPHERMVALLEGRLGQRERLDTMSRILEHPACRAEFAMMRTVWEAAGGSAGRRRRWTAGLLRAAAAIALLIGAASVVTTLRRGGGRETLRGPGTTIALIAPTGAIEAGPLVLAWHPSSGADHYEAVIADSGGLPVLSRTTADTSVAAGTLPPGRYRWWVRATRPDGAILRSPIQPFTVGR